MAFISAYFPISLATYYKFITLGTREIERAGVVATSFPTSPLKPPQTPNLAMPRLYSPSPVRPPTFIKSHRVIYGFSAHHK